MIVQCQQCTTKFRLDDGRVTEAGVKVRCSKCRHVFVVRKETPEEEPFVDEPVAAPVVVAPSPEPEVEFPAAAVAPEAADFGFADVDEPPPGLTAGAEDFHFGEPPEEEEAKPYFEVNYPPPREDEFDFSDFELKIDEDKPVEAAPVADDGFDFGDFAETEPQGKHDFDILPPREEEEFSLSTSAATSSAQDFVADDNFAAEASPKGEPLVAEDAPIDFGPLAADESSDAAAERVAGGDTAAGEAGGRDEARTEEQFDELPPFVMSRRQGSSFFPLAVTALAVIFVLVMAGAGVFFLKEGPEGFNRLGLGFIPKWFGAEPREEGRIALGKIEASFVKNAEAGEVFVIRGEALNEYKKARASIQVKGIVYGKNGAEVAQKTIYCGNSISNELISALPLSKIETTMNNQFGDSLSNLGVPPGKSIPFVIVIANVPRDASDYGVEVAGSTVASQQ